MSSQSCRNFPLLPLRTREEQSHGHRGSWNVQDGRCGVTSSVFLCAQGVGAALDHHPGGISLSVHPKSQTLPRLIMLWRAPAANTFAPGEIPQIPGTPSGT